MALSSSEDQYFVYENRLASFQGPQPITKRRASNASSRAPKALTWPHKKLSPSSFAKAGFVFQPTPANPDNVVCFLCNKSLDGWEEDDDPLVEHLKHVPDCGWAIVAAVEAELGEYARLHPLDPQMIAARKATFAGRWPYDAKKAWKCKTKQLVDAGWYYSPTVESDDMATCAYCQLALDGWEAGDKPMDEHHKRCPDCAFFLMINANPAPKKARATKAGRASKASRLSVQSVATTMSDLQSAAGDMTLDPDASIMTTTSVATTGGKKGRPRKAAAAKTRKTKSKKDEAVEILEDADDVDVPPAPPPKPTRSRKRGSEAIEDSVVMNPEAPAPKKRATKGGRTTEAVDDPIASMDVIDHEVDIIEAPAPPTKQPAALKKARALNAKTTTRKASAASLRAKASTASLRAQAAMDEELEQQLQADLERPLTDDGPMIVESESAHGRPAPATKKNGGKAGPSSQKASARSQREQDDYAMFDPAPVMDDDAQVDEELRALEAEMSAEKDHAPLEVPKKGRKTGTRKVSKQTKKAKGVEAPPKDPKAVDEPEEESIVVTQEPQVDSAPQAFEDPADTSSGTVVNKTSSAPATQAKRGRGRPKKSSTTSASAEDEAQPVDTTIEPTTKQPETETELMNAPDPTSMAPAPPAKAPLRSSPSAASQPKSTRGVNKSLPPAPPSPPPQSEKPAPPTPGPDPATPRARHIAPTASAKQATISPSQSPQSSDAENQPPSSKPAGSVAAKRVGLAPVPLPPTTPGRRHNGEASPSRAAARGCWRSTQPWKPVGLDLVLGLVGGGPGGEGCDTAEEVDRLLRRRGEELSTPERGMTVEEWIFHNADVAERMLRAECEAMVGKFEVEGGRAIRVLEGLVVE